MKKRSLLALALACAPVVAQDPFISGEALQEDIKRFAEGCIVLTREEAAALMQQVQMMVEQRAQQAYQAGKLACRNAT